MEHFKIRVSIYLFSQIRDYLGVDLRFYRTGCSKELIFVYIWFD